jgi:hypothetical protein
MSALVRISDSFGDGSALARTSASDHKRTLKRLHPMSALKSRHHLRALGCPLCAKRRHSALEQGLALFDYLVGAPPCAKRRHGPSAR